MQKNAVIIIEIFCKVRKLAYIIIYPNNDLGSQSIIDCYTSINSKKVKIPQNKIISTISIHGNTSAASIPLALDVAMQKGNIKNGNILALQAIGGGLSWGSIILKIGKPV